MGLPSMKNQLSKCWGCLSLLSWVGAHALSALIKLHLKIGTLIRSIKFILRVRSINLPSDLAFCLVGTFPLIGNVPLVGTRYTD